jgi:hypothetical protein
MTVVITHCSINTDSDGTTTYNPVGGYAFCPAPSVSLLDLNRWRILISLRNISSFRYSF